MPEPARGLILFEMKVFLTALLLTLPAAAVPCVAAAQDTQGDGRVIIQIPPVDELPPPEPLQIPPIDDPLLENPLLDDFRQGITPDRPDADRENADDLDVDAMEGEDIVPEDIAPDYSKLSPRAERAAKLDDLFAKLAEREDEKSANLVAEEIVAIWMESGSASVNLLLRRGSDAAAKGDPKTARKMYNHAVDLSPEFAEAWARSARLALTQKNYNRALNESLTALTLEPRHFYTLWTLGNVLEVLNRPDEALETYREANRLYPELKVVKDRLAELENEVDGTVL